jgi:hypothetical protein
MVAASRSSPAKDYVARRKGWLTFAGTLFILIGAFNLIDGLIALAQDEYFVVTEDGLLFSDFTAWGWFFLIFGIVQVAVGFGIFSGRGWARVTGVALAMFSAVCHIAFLVAFPLFGLITIGLSVLVIYALLVPAEPEPYEQRILE